MEYRITITDNWNEGSVVVSSEKVAARSVQLAHRGGDRIDTTIIGSSLSWTFVGLDCSDGRYAQLFTGDENRFEVTLEDDDNQVIWKGFLLPDSYQEPYRNYVQDVSFQATDGLGRLKGKFIENLSPEVSVIDAISNILRLTGLELDLLFAPAITNSLQSDFKEVYVPSQNWENPSAFDILDDIATSLGASVYQVSGAWRFIGWNFRMRPIFSVMVYGPFSNFKGVQTIFRDFKQGQVLAGGNIFMQPPYGVVEIDFNREPVRLPETLSSPGEPEWVDFGASVSEKFATGWEVNTAFPILTNTEEVFFRIVQDGQVSLERKPYLLEGQRYRVRLSFSIEVELVDGEEPEYFYTSPFDFRIQVGEQIIRWNKADNAAVQGFYFTNMGTPVVKEDRRTYEIEEEFVVAESGYFDIILTAQNQFNTAGIEKILIEEATLEPIDVNLDLSLRRVLNDRHTLVKSINLPYGDDATGVSSAFRLYEINEPTGSTSYSDNSVRFFQHRGLWHYVVDLKLANLVDLNRNAVYDATGPVSVEDVAYNWMGGQEHVIISEDFFFHTIGGQPLITVQVAEYEPILEKRTGWTKWRDAAYGVEFEGFVDTYANMVGRIFSAPLAASEVTVQSNIKFDDILRLPYSGDKRWALTQCIWDIDRGDTSLVATQINSEEIFPPVIVIEKPAHSPTGVFTLNASAVALEGEIDYIEWEVLAGPGSLSPTTGESTTLTLSGGWATVQATVYDTFGRSNSDTITVYKFLSTAVTLDRTSGPGSWEYEVNLTPEIPDGFVVNLIGHYSVYIAGDPEYEIKIIVDGVEVVSESNEDNSELGQRYGIYRTFSFAYIAGSDIKIIADIDRKDVVNIIRVGLSIDEAYFKEGEGELSGLPATVDIEFI